MRRTQVPQARIADRLFLSVRLLLQIYVVSTALVISGLELDGTAGSAPPRPHLISILQDDLGFFDSGIHNSAARDWSGNISHLADKGVRLNWHYAHWHCSPSRRSFLTGRLPIHHGEQLSSNSGDDIDLRMAWISDKLAALGYNAHWFGKYHTGFRSMNHLPFAHGFSASSTGSLQTGGDYSGPHHSTRWQGRHPIVKDSQFANKPPGCPTETHSNLHQSICNESAFLHDIILPCGVASDFTNATSAEACCAACAASGSTVCTHWVFNPSDTDRPPCHLKRGGVSDACEVTRQGATSGLPENPSSDQCVDEYSTDLWGELALQAVTQHNASDHSRPLYVHLCFQAVHVPYQSAPGDPTGSIYRGMLWRADVFIGQLVMLLKSKGMYDNTLIMYSSDNGGVVDGINFPLRGEKHSNWEGAMRVAAFVSGGFVPKNVRGTHNNHTMHLVDWYPTFIALAGGDGTDNPPKAPLAPDLTRPFRYNIYGNKSFPPVDGSNVWPLIVNPSAYPDVGAAHNNLVLSKQVLIRQGRWKLLVSQPYFKSQNNGWKGPNGVWRNPLPNETFPACMEQDQPPESGLFFPVPGRVGHSPCLFDLRADPGEHVDLSAVYPEMVAQLWKHLNATVATQRDCNGWSYKGVQDATIPGPWVGANSGSSFSTSCSPKALLGECNANCSTHLWTSKWGITYDQGPMCAVPECL